MQKSFTILVIDDSPTQLAVLQDALEERGFSVVTAGNGMEAITRVYQSPPDLIVSDVMMPELNGYHLCRLLKNDNFTAHIPIILLSNRAERHDRFWGENAGAERYLEKTPDLEPILATVAEFLKRTSPADPTSSDPSPRKLARGEIQSRVTAILDRLLYESTISNEILKFTGLTHDINTLAEEFLRFLSALCRYRLAGLLLVEGRDRYLLCLQCHQPINQADLEQARQKILVQADLAPLDPSQMRTLCFPRELTCESSPVEGLHLLHSRPIRDEGGLLALLTLFDTEERELSEGMRHALQVVADRFLIVARYLRKYREIEDVKADFISMLVHDLRAPLTGISGFTDVLAEGSFGKITEGQGAALKNIKNGCAQLLGLIDDILDISKLEAGKMGIHAAPLQIRKLAERSVADLKALFMEKNQQVEITMEASLPPVLGDGKQLARVLANLLTNATKFTPHGGRITVEANLPDSPRPPSLENCLLVTITDTGDGIPAPMQDRLFSRYQQLPTAAMFRKGTGLGLAICREIITLHGGEIWVTSPVTEDGGSRFTFSLPLASP